MKKIRKNWSHGLLIRRNLFTCSVCYSLSENKDANSETIHGRDQRHRQRRTSTTSNYTLMTSAHWM